MNSLEHESIPCMRGSIHSRFSQGKKMYFSKGLVDIRDLQDALPNLRISDADKEKTAAVVAAAHQEIPAVLTGEKGITSSGVIGEFVVVQPHGLEVPFPGDIPFPHYQNRTAQLIRHNYGRGLMDPQSHELVEKGDIHMCSPLLLERLRYERISGNKCRMYIDDGRVRKWRMTFTPLVEHAMKDFVINQYKEQKISPVYTAHSIVTGALISAVDRYQRGAL